MDDWEQIDAALDNMWEVFQATKNRISDFVSGEMHALEVAFSELIDRFEEAKPEESE
jgi:hypothetical protein